MEGWQVEESSLSPVPLASEAPDISPRPLGRGGGGEGREEGWGEGWQGEESSLSRFLGRGWGEGTQMESYPVLGLILRFRTTGAAVLAVRQSLHSLVSQHGGRSDGWLRWSRPSPERWCTFWQELRGDRDHHRDAGSSLTVAYAIGAARNETSRVLRFAALTPTSPALSPPPFSQRARRYQELLPMDLGEGVLSDLPPLSLTLSHPAESGKCSRLSCSHTTHARRYVPPRVVRIST